MHMTLNRRTLWISGGAFGLALLLTSVAVVRGWRALSPSDLAVDESVRAGAKAYSSLSVEPIETVEDIRSRLAGATVLNADLADEVAASRLLDTAAGFFDLWLGGPFDSYCAWQESRGARLKSRQEMVEVGHVAAAFRVCLNKEFPDGLSSRELLGQMILANPVTADGRNSQAAAMASTGEGVAIGFGHATPANPDPVDVKTTIPGELWYGQAELIGRNWWVPRITLEELLRRHKRVLYAEIGIIIVSDRGRRHPIMTAWVFDPTRSEWQLETLTMANFGPDFGATCLEY